MSEAAKKKQGGIEELAEQPNITAMSESAFPFDKPAPPQQGVWEATISLSNQVQDAVNAINLRADETGWMFAIVPGGVRDTDAVTRMKGNGYTVLTAKDVEALAAWYEGSIPLNAGDVLMRKERGQWLADKGAAQALRDARRPDRKSVEDVGDKQAMELGAESTVIRVQSPNT